MSDNIFRFTAMVQTDVDTMLMVYLNHIEVGYMAGQPRIELYHDSNGVVSFRPMAILPLNDDEILELRGATKEQRIDFVFKYKDRIQAI